MTLSSMLLVPFKSPIQMATLPCRSQAAQKSHAYDNVMVERSVFARGYKRTVTYAGERGSKKGRKHDRQVIEPSNYSKPSNTFLC